MNRSRIPLLLFVLALVAVGAIGAVSFYRTFSTVPGERLICTGQYETFYRVPKGPVTPEFSSCTLDSAKRFTGADYPEVKDLAKAFMTIIVAVFVASIAFSEKIINIATAGVWSKGLMILTWIALFVSICACGAGLAFMVIAFGWATYFPFSEYRQLEIVATKTFLASCILFGAALMLMLINGISTMFNPSTPRSAA